MVQKKLNKKRLFAVIFTFVFIIAFILFTIFLAKKKNSIEYKLETIGYSESDIKYITEKFNDTEKNKILSMDYYSELIALSKEKKFRFDKLDQYLEYMKKIKDITPEETVTKINTHTNIDFYDEILETDTSKKELMLVNKVYKLSEDYAPEDIVLISSKYAYQGKYISESIMENLASLIDDGYENNYKFIVNTGYRSYKDQEIAYNKYKLNNGIREADIYVARPGHSDYQTGLALNLEIYGKKIEDVNASEEYTWLTENAYKYGFILRYPKDKESITGFQYDPWRIRYVGVEASTYIYNNDITFEEYYGYKM